MSQVSFTAVGNSDQNKNFFLEINTNYRAQKIFSMSTSDPSSMTGSLVNERPAQNNNHIRIKLGSLITSFTDNLLLPEYLSQKLDNYIEGLILFNKNHIKIFNQFYQDVSYYTIENIFHELRRYCPNLKIQANTIDKLSGAIQFNRISPMTVSEGFIDDLTYQSQIFIDKKSDNELLSSLLRLKQIVDMKKISLNKKRKRNREFELFLTNE